MLSINDLNEISQLLDQKLDEKLSPIKKDIKYMKKTQEVMLDLLDREQMHQRKRINRIEDHLGLPPLPSQS